jgi:hypothetical protein
LVFLIIFLKKKYFFFKHSKIQFKKIDLVVVLIAVTGIFGQIMPFIKTGLVSVSGLFISSYNSCDHVWHASLAQELAQRFPPNEPSLFGIAFINYNFWFHPITGELTRVFNLPLLSVQFNGMYPMASILLAFIGYVFAINLYNSKLFARLFLFFLFFSGDAFGWLLSLLRHSLTLNISVGLDDATKFMDTPGYGLSVIIALTAFYVFLRNKEKLSLKNMLIVATLIGSLIGFKIYMGIPFLLGLFFMSIPLFIKRNFTYFWMFVIAVVLSVIQFLPFNSNNGGLFFLPFEVPRGFMAQKALNLGFIDQRWTIYLAHHSYFRLLEYGLFMTAVFLLVQFGVKILGFIPLKRAIRILGTDFCVLLYSILISSLILSLFFYQRVGGGTIWEFLLATSLMLTIFASLNLSLILAKINKIVTVTIIILIVAFTIPSWVNFVNYYLQADYFSSFHGISAAELKSYAYLKDNSPKNSTLLLIDEPSYNCFSSIVNVLTERNLFFSGQGVSQVVWPWYTGRKNDVVFIKTSRDDQEVDELLKKDNINYVVLYNNTLVGTTSALLNNRYLEKAFSNSADKIFKVN